MPSQPGVPLLVALVLLVVVAMAAATIGHLRVRRDVGIAAARAVVQLALVSLIITAALSHLLWSLAFAVVMFGVAVFTTSRRVEAPRSWRWSAVALASGVIPVLAVIFLSRAVPWNGPSLVPMAGIIIGGTMSAHSLLGRRCFAALRDEHGAYEAALSLGFLRSRAIAEIIDRRMPEALVPGLDQTRTVGLVTLPGAFVGVLLGGGTPLQAGAAQIIVLVGLMAAQTITVAVAGRLIRSARLLPADLASALRP